MLFVCNNTVNVFFFFLKFRLRIIETGHYMSLNETALHIIIIYCIIIRIKQFGVSFFQPLRAERDAIKLHRTAAASECICASTSAV